MPARTAQTAGSTVSPGAIAVRIVTSTRGMAANTQPAAGAPEATPETLKAATATKSAIAASE
jgi:hypothetical protein